MYIDINDKRVNAKIIVDDKKPNLCWFLFSMDFGYELEIYDFLKNEKFVSYCGIQDNICWFCINDISSFYQTAFNGMDEDSIKLLCELSEETINWVNGENKIIKPSIFLRIKEVFHDSDICFDGRGTLVQFNKVKVYYFHKHPIEDDVKFFDYKKAVLSLLNTQLLLCNEGLSMRCRKLDKFTDSERVYWRWIISEIERYIKEVKSIKI